MVLARLQLGFFEKDLADRFNVSVSTVSRICRAWITFLHMRSKELPLWPSRDLVQTYMPRSFKDLYYYLWNLLLPRFMLWQMVMDLLYKHNMRGLSVQHLLGPLIIEKMHCFVQAMQHACCQASKAGLFESQEVVG